MAWSEQKKGWVMMGVFCGLAIIVLAGSWMGRGGGGGDEAFDSIEYQGERFKLSKTYRDYEEYKDDSNNLSPGQEGKLERAVVGAKVERSYASVEEMVRAVFEVKFPGYGLSSLNGKSGADGVLLDVERVEIPRLNKDRVIVFRGRIGGRFTRVDDFVLAEDVDISAVREEKGELVYSNATGKEVMRRKEGE